MAKRERPINVLWIDDEHEHEKLQNFRGLLHRNRIIVKRAVTNSQEGMQELRKNPHDYDAVILDAKAFKQASDVVGTETMGALRISINAIRDISNEQNRYIPFCVYTGYFDDMDDVWEDDLVIFSKGRDQYELINYIKAQISELPSSAVIDSHRDVFEIFDKELFSRKYRDHLIGLLLSIDSKDGKEIVDLMVKCRKMQEGVYKTLDDQGRLHPEVFYQDGRPNLGWCLRFLEGKKIDQIDIEIPDRFVPEHIASSMRLVQSLGSIFGAHDCDYKASNYTLKTTVYALMDVLLWLKGVL